MATCSHSWVTQIAAHVLGTETLGAVLHERLCVCSGDKAAAAPRARAAIACHSWINLKVLLLGMELAGKERHQPLVLVFVRIEASSGVQGPLCR